MRLERLVDRAVGEVVREVGNDRHGDSEDDLQSLRLGIPGRLESSESLFSHAPTISHQEAGEVAQRSKLGLGWRPAHSQGLNRVTGDALLQSER